jgi:hypothetical protein
MFIKLQVLWNSNRSVIFIRFFKIYAVSGPFSFLLIFHEFFLINIAKICRKSNSQLDYINNNLKFNPNWRSIHTLTETC